MANIRIQFDVTVPSFAFRALLTAALVLVCAPELVSESVTLSTYYPAPSGVYTQMIVTGPTVLARDSGSVGVGTTTPAHKLDVVGDGRFSTTLDVGTNETVGGNVTIAGSQTVGASQTVGGNQSVGGDLQVSGNSTITLNETVGGFLAVNGKYVKIAGGGPGCGGAWRNGDIWGTLCPGGFYATFTTGLYVEGWSYQARGNTSMDSSGDAYILCCPK